MKTSISVTNFSWRDGTMAARLGEIAEAADAGGLDALWVADHVLQTDPYGAGPGETEMLESATTLGYLAARTSRIRLGTLVSAVTFRPPALLIKAVTTLDVMSGGRALFGIGAGYQADEAAAMGLPLPPLPERFDRLEETLQIALRMWAGDAQPYRGTYYTLDAPLCSPLPISRPHPPILIGGTGEKRTLPLVARYAEPATSSTSPTAARPRGASWACCASCASGSAGRTTRSRRSWRPGSGRVRAPPRSPTAAPASRRSASTTWWSSPAGPGPSRPWTPSPRPPAVSPDRPIPPDLTSPRTGRPRGCSQAPP